MHWSMCSSIYGVTRRLFKRGALQQQQQQQQQQQHVMAKQSAVRIKTLLQKNTLKQTKNSNQLPASTNNVNVIKIRPATIYYQHEIWKKRTTKSQQIETSTSTVSSRNNKQLVQNRHRTHTAMLQNDPWCSDAYNTNTVKKRPIWPHKTGCVGRRRVTEEELFAENRLLGQALWRYHAII